MNLDELSEYLKIDRTSLDEEIIRQPSLFYKISEYYAKTVAQKDFAKENLAKVDADLIPIVTTKIEKSGQRATEGRISAALTQEKKHIKAHEDYIQAKVENEKAQGLKDAFSSRAYMLRDLVSLFVANYFEKDSVIVKTSNEKEIIYKKNREKLDKKRRKIRANKDGT